MALQDPRPDDCVMRADLSKYAYSAVCVLKRCGFMVDTWRDFSVLNIRQLKRYRGMGPVRMKAIRPVIKKAKDLILMEPVSFLKAPKCFDCTNGILHAEMWNVVVGHGDVCLQVDVSDPCSGRNIRAEAPFPIAVWCCSECGRVERPTDFVAWSHSFAASKSKVDAP